jgi:hypothetical protein
VASAATAPDAVTAANRCRGVDRVGRVRISGAYICCSWLISALLRLGVTIAALMLVRE